MNFLSSVLAYHPVVVVTSLTVQMNSESCLVWFCAVLGTEHGVFCLLGKCSATEASPNQEVSWLLSWVTQ